ncbi:MAG TPA: PAS domain-containing protein [Chthonomonadaceae bacterium]|nr:PAS domain-containing protein [Chthonomonadaceae bacterium]
MTSITVLETTPVSAAETDALLPVGLAPETTHALLTRPTPQAETRAALPDGSREAGRLPETLLRANAEQARRVADCLRSFHEALLGHLAQPCFAIDREGRITRWNAAMEAWSGLLAQGVVNRPLAEIICPSFEKLMARALHAALTGRKPAGCEGDNRAFRYAIPLALLPGLDAVPITFLPLCRIPGYVESVVALIEL